MVLNLPHQLSCKYWLLFIHNGPESSKLHTFITADIVCSTTECILVCHTLSNMNILQTCSMHHVVWSWNMCDTEPACTKTGPWNWKQLNGIQPPFILLFKPELYWKRFIKTRSTICDTSCLVSVIHVVWMLILLNRNMEFSSVHPTEKEAVFVAFAPH